ncbi:MAG: response regulator [Bacilli bacterium]|nr:response regulator [Bacilli bacterium]
MDEVLKILSIIMVFVGVAIMTVNIVLYFLFMRRIRNIKSIKNKGILLYFPFLLLIFFLIGYILVGALGNPDVIMSAILFGGSIYVFVLIIALNSIISRILESDKLMKLRYDDILADYERMINDSNFVAYVNLTKDFIVERKGKIFEEFKDVTYSGFLNHLRQSLIERYNSKERQALLTREGLIQSFEEGHNNVSEIVLIQRDVHPHFVKIDVEIVKQPETGNIMAFIVERDYNREAVNESILNTVLEVQYDMVAYFHQCNYEILVSSPQASYLPKKKDGDFKEFLEEIIYPQLADETEKELISPEKVTKELKQNKSYECVIVLKGEEDEVFYKKYSFYSLNQTTEMYTLLVSDITQEHLRQVELNQKLSLALKESEKATQAKTMFFSNMSHDIRTPMNAIIGFIELSKKTEDSQIKENYLNKIESASKHLLSLINDILSMSRIESGKLTLVPEECSLHEIIESIHNLFQEQMNQKGLEFIVNDEIRHPFVLLDKNRFNRVLVNLINNGLKYTEQGSVTLSVKELEANEKEATYRFSVLDTGIGMSEEFATKIYNVFERERTMDAKNIQGTGLGMAITKSIVELMKGKLELVTELGKGSEFIVTITLPLLDHTLKEEHHEEMMDIRELIGLKVLLVEDNEINQEIATLLLKSQGMEVIQAKDGQEGLDKLDETIDIVLTDIQMPVLSGYEMTKKIRKDHPCKDVPIIALTADAFKEDIEKALDSGINAVSTKPIDQEDLFSKMIAAIHHEI